MSDTKLPRQQILQDKYMLNQFRSNLLASISRLHVPDNDKTTELKEKISADVSWSEANQVELALVDFYDSTTLHTEWQRRLAEAHTLPQHLIDFYAANNTVTDEATTRSLLARLVTDLQWRRESHRVIRFNESRMRTNIVFLFLFSFVLFFSPTFFRVVFEFEFEFNNLRIYYLFTAATSGILGAGFSQLTSIQSRVTDATVSQVKAMSKVGYILARSMVGAGAGLIMFYLLQSGLLSGAFFPAFIQDTSTLNEIRTEMDYSVVNSLVVNPETVNSIEVSSENNTPDNTPIQRHGVSLDIEYQYDLGTLAKPAQGLSLLIIWCLLAGYSEKLIPGILKNKSKKTSDATQ